MDRFTGNRLGFVLVIVNDLLSPIFLSREIVGRDR